MTDNDVMGGEDIEIQMIEVEVYKSAKKADTYLYLPVGADRDSLPDLLQEQFGEGEPFLRFELTNEKYLAQADPRNVLASLNGQGFYLQLPPQKERNDDV